MNKIKKLVHKIRFVIVQVFKASPIIGLICILTVLFDGGLPIIEATILKYIIFHIENYKGDFSNTITIIVALLVVEFLALSIQKVINNYRAILGRIASMKITYRMQSMILNKVKKIPFSYFDDPEFHNLYSNAQGQTNTSLSNLVVNTFGMLSFIVTFISFSVVVINFNLYCFILITITALPTLFFKFGFQGKLFELVFKDTKIQREQGYYYSVMSSPNSVREVKIFGLYSFFEKRRKKLFYEHFNNTLNLAKKELIGNLFVNLLAKTGTYISILILIIIFLSRGLPISDFTLILTAMTSIETTIYVIVEVLASNHNNLLFLDYFFDFINYPEENLDTKNIPINSINTIEFRNVSFKYPNTERYLLKDFSFKIFSGESVAIIGENGSGKSTLIKLLLQLYKPNEGRILINNNEIQEYQVDLLSRLFAPVFQDFTKFAVTIKENVVFGNIHCNDDKKLINALKITNLYDYVSKLKNQTDSQLTRLFSTSGEELSIGQWQKLCIARALYSNADVLVLDEPSAALDPKTENMISEHLLSLKGKKTVLIITHRLSYLKNVDKVIFFSKNGNIKINSHDFLYKNDAEYKKYYDGQAEKYM